MSAAAVAAALLAAGALIWLGWRLFRLCRALRREREENRRLRGLLQTGALQAQADLEQLRRLRHDLRQYLVLAERSPFPEAAAALRASLEAAPPPCGWESWALSALEQHYRERAEALGLRADLRIVPPPAWEEAVPDLCLVLSNLLENGVEALEREGSGWLRARSVSAAGYFSLVVGNTCTHPPQAVNGHYLSSKVQGRFGIGLETVREVAERYGGQAEFAVRDGEFRASVFLLRPKFCPPEPPAEPASPAAQPPSARP